KKRKVTELRAGKRIGKDATGIIVDVCGNEPRPDYGQQQQDPGLPALQPFHWTRTYGNQLSFRRINESRSKGQQRNAIFLKNCYCARNRASSAAAVRPLYLLFRDLEGRIGGGHAGIDRHLEERLGDVAGFQAVRDCGAQMQAELLPSSERRRYGQHQQAAGAMIEAGARPHASPGIAGKQLLKVVIELRGPGQSALNMVRAQNPAADLQAGFVSICGSLIRQKKVEQRMGEGARLLKVGEMRRVEPDGLRVRYLLREHRAVGIPGG